MRKSLKAPFTKGFGLAFPPNNQSFLSQANEILKSVFNYDSYCCYGGQTGFLLKTAGKFFVGFSLGSMAVPAEYFRSRSELELSPVPAQSQGWCKAGSRGRGTGTARASSSVLGTAKSHLQAQAYHKAQGPFCKGSNITCSQEHPFSRQCELKMTPFILVQSCFSLGSTGVCCLQ